MAQLILVVVAAAISALLVRVKPTQADDASQAWSGLAEARGNYYYERSTRVVAPAVVASATSPEGTELQAGYLVDAITSASLASGVVSDANFTEIRHDIQAGASHEWTWKTTPVRLGLNTHASVEPDYTSYGLGIYSVWALQQRATLLRAGVVGQIDDVGRILRGINAGTIEGVPTQTSTRADVGTLRGLGWSLSVSHALSSVFMLRGGYDLAFADGFLANAYRTVTVAGTPLPEAHPDQRLRHTLHIGSSWYVPNTHTALSTTLRGYVDSWDIWAFNPELELSQHLSERSLVGLTYRYYVQNAASFYKAPVEYTSEDRYRTADPKMTAFHNHLLGVYALFHLGWLERSPLEFISNASVDLTVQHLWNNNRFGNGIIAQTSLQVPF